MHSSLYFTHTSHFSPSASNIKRLNGTCLYVINVVGLLYIFKSLSHSSRQSAIHRDVHTSQSSGQSAIHEDVHTSQSSGQSAIHQSSAARSGSQATTLLAYVNVEALCTRTATVRGLPSICADAAPRVHRPRAFFVCPANRCAAV